ncbi:MAG: accessory factor UbiK family protein [Tatlockia sp.]|nr:accessory factor UbiK family protein [Tatlockia sp.]
MQFEDLAKKLFSALPTNLQNMEKEIEQKFKEILQAAFARLDLVTREEFDIQTKVLARTREKLDTLQGQVENLLTIKAANKENEKH